MRIRILSDLHTELRDFTPPELLDPRSPRGKDLQDVVVLAGDIGSGASAIRWAAKSFADVPVVFVHGNHEFYNGHISMVALAMKAAAQGTNVHILDNDELIQDGVRFLGTTLWTDFELFGRENRAYALAVARQCMGDVSCITHGSTGWLTPDQSVLLHRQAVTWLERKLNEPFDGRTVVN